MSNTRYKIAPYVKVGYSEDTLKVGFGSIQQKIDSLNLQNAVLDLFEILLKFHSLEDIKHICQNNLNLNSDDAVYIYKFVTEGNLLIKENIYDKKDRHSRHALFYNLSNAEANIVQEKLSSKKAIIAGCGGIGNLISVTLATAGIAELILVDDDIIEISNLTRQLMFTENDVGHLKTEILQQQILSRASNVKVSSYNIKLNTLDDFISLPQADLLILSGDSPNLTSITNLYSFKNNVPFLHVGYVQDIAVWGPLIIPKSTPCFECFMKKNIANKSHNSSFYDEKIKKINSRHQAPSIGPVNMLAASHASLDILKYLGDFSNPHSLGKRIGVWTHNLKIEYQEYTRHLSCPICSV